MTRPPIDWEAIEREYRAGQLSIREIARQFGCAKHSIEKRAKRDSWRRDLTKAVQAETKRLITEQVAGKVASGHAREIIKAAGLRAAEVIARQRADIEPLRQFIFDTLHAVEAEAVANGGPGRGAEPKDAAGMSRDWANALSRLHEMERKAFNIGQSGAGDDGVIKDRAHAEAIARAFLGED